MASVRVAVRVRPLNKREKLLKAKMIIHVKGNTTSIFNIKHSPKGIRNDGQRNGGKHFSYDFAYDSTDRESLSYVSQEKIFQDLGSDVLKAAFAGFNACVFAYGQTGSGKSYTMMGDTGDKGLIPRICEGLFCKISERTQSDAVSFRTEVSYLEIYNERVQDLLKRKFPSTDAGGLRVREHPKDGPYVEGLSKHLVHNYSDLEDVMTAGNANRTTASTGMNDVSSRSHAIFTIHFSQAQFDEELPCETLSKIHLVDLAGSERADATRTTGTRLKEGANINKSLVTLGGVISALADLNEGGQTTKKKKQIFIPYRDSVLTWLLKDSLGGNSKTIMIATISPADVNYGETLSTLRYAHRAKNIVNTPTVNEDSRVRVIRELQAEIARLRGLVDQATQAPYGDLSSTFIVEEKLHQNEAKVLELTKEWTSKWGETHSILKEETLALRKAGSGVVLDSQLPHLIGIDEDLLSTGIILYHLKEGRTLVGCGEASPHQDIVLHGSGLLSEHCVFENQSGTVNLIPMSEALCSVNGMEVTQPQQLTQGAIIQLGRGTMFRFNHPTEAAQLREKRKSGLLSTGSLSMSDPSMSTENLAKVMLLSPGQQEVEWQQVQESLHRLNQDIERRPQTLLKQRGDTEQERTEEEEEPKGEMEGLSSRLTRGDALHCVNGEVDEAKVGEMTADLKRLQSEQLQPLLGKDLEDCKSRMDMLAAVNADSRLPSSSVLSASPETHMSMVIPGKCPASHGGSEVDGDALQGGRSTRDGQEQERDWPHKSGPGLVRGAESGAQVECCRGGREVWPGDARLQQTGVLGLVDGCGAGPEGNANESQGVVADCYKGRPGSGGTSLGNVSHLQRTGGTSSRSVLPQASTNPPILSTQTHSSQAAHCPPEEGQLSHGVIDGSRALEDIQQDGEAETEAVVEQSSRLGSLVSTLSWMFQGTGRLLRRSPGMLQQVREEGLQPTGARLSSQMVSLVRESQVLSVVKDSQVFSLVKESKVFSLVTDSQVFSMVKELPLTQHIQMELTQDLNSEETARTVQALPGPDTALTLSQAQNTAKVAELSQDSVQEGNWSINGSKIRELESPQQKDAADTNFKPGQNEIKEPVLPEKQSCESQACSLYTNKNHQTSNSERSTNLAPESQERSVTVQESEGVKMFRQKLVDFPEALLNLQSLPLPTLVASIQSIFPPSVFTSQKTLALYWLSVAKCSHPQPRPALLILLETGLYAVTADPGHLVLFHHLPLLQLKEVQMGLAGQSLRLMGTTVESILGLHTYSQTLTQELCRALLGVLYPEDSRVSQHPLLQEDLMGLSLDWQAYVPDLLLDAGLRVCSQFQKTLADLVYLLHGNMDQEKPSVGEVRLLMYTSVGVCVSPNPRSEPLAQLFLTDTHLGLVQEDTMFHPTPRSIPLVPCRAQFQDVTLRCRSDIRCVMVHDGDGSRAEEGAIRLDVILAQHVGGRGHPEMAARVAVPSAQASNSSPQAEVWKLTFSCSAEAARLINHLSNV